MHSTFANCRWRTVAVSALGWAAALGALWAQPAGTPVPISVPALPDSTLHASIDSARPEEEVKLSAAGSFSVQHARVGDTVAYTLRVEWKDLRVPVVVMAPESLSTPGFRIATQSAEHRKSVAGNEIRNVTEFIYQLVPTIPGSAHVEPLKLRYLTGFSNREEALYVPGAFLDVGPARVPLRDRGWFRALLALLSLAAVLAAGWEIRRRWRARRRRAPQKIDFVPAVRTLKSRCQSAESRAWMQEAEQLCTSYLRQQLGATNGARFEFLLDAYLDQEPSQVGSAEEADGWSKLRDLFRQARYAGGRKEPHELQDACRTLKTCLHIPGELES